MLSAGGTISANLTTRHPRQSTSFGCTPGTRYLEYLNFTGRGLSIHKNMLCPGRAQLIAQVANCFIIIRCDSMLCIWDQHAMHERVRIENFLTALQKPHQQVIRQSTKPLKPLVLSKFSARDLSILQEAPTKDFFARFFLEYQIVATCVLVRSRPCIVEEPLPDVEELFKALLKDFREIKAYSCSDNLQQVIPPCIRDILISKACRGAIMFHTKLSRVTCKSLLQEVSQTSFPFNCAHGRPSVAPLAMLKHNLAKYRPTTQHIIKGAKDTARSQTSENDSSASGAKDGKPHTRESEDAPLRFRLHLGLLQAKPNIEKLVSSQKHN